VKLHEVMIHDVIQIGEAEDITAAAKRMSEFGVGCLVVTSSGLVKGIVTGRDLLVCLAQDHDPRRCRVSWHMRHPVIVLSPEEEIATAAEVMRRRRIKRLPVAKNGKLPGIVSLSDLAAIANAEAEKLAMPFAFFMAVMRAQASHPTLAKPERLEETTVSMAETNNGNRRDNMLDLGGSG
jgi:signal-transduction protein with cAMP-binding, CBS, and nucleotidyltransferase domain